MNGLAVAFPDAASRRRVARVPGRPRARARHRRPGEKQSVVSTQLRTLSASITDPANAATSGSGSGDSSDSTLMSDYLAELGAAFPEVKSLDAYKDGVKAAKALEKNASIADALKLSDSFASLADHFDDKPGATLSPKSLAGTASAKEFKKEAEDTFNALPDQLSALAAVFATRPDDFYLPTSLTGDDARSSRTRSTPSCPRTTRRRASTSRRPTRRTPGARSRSSRTPGSRWRRVPPRSDRPRPATSAAPPRSSPTSRTRWPRTS